MNVESLKTFLTLAQLQNFTKTAQKHNVVQSTVSARIKELERELNVRLFTRDQKKVTMTEAGNQFYAYAERIVNLENQARDQLMAVHVFPYRLRIGTAFTIYSSHLRDCIQRYMDLHKNVSINLRVYDSMSGIENLNANIMDVCFSYASFFSSQTVCYPFRSERMVLVTSHKNRERRDGVLVNEIRELPLLITHFNLTDTPLWYDQLLADYNLFSLQTNAGTFILPLLRSGVYYSALPRSVVAEELDSGALVEIPLLNGEWPVVQSYILTKRRSMDNRAVADLLDLCLENQVQVGKGEGEAISVS